MKNLINWSIKHAAMVLIAAGLLVGWTGLQLPKMSVDVFPELNAPTVTILTEAGGLSADEVEQWVTFPIESIMNGIPGIRRVRSSSAGSLSFVWVEFDWGEDIYRARQLVSERLSMVRGDLPNGITPIIGPPSSIAGEVMLIALSDPDNNVGLLELRALAEFDIRNRITAIPGVAQVVAIGGYMPEYTIEVDQNQLALYKLTTEQVIDAARGSHTTETAGYLQNYQGREMPLRQSGRVKSIDDIKQTVVSYDKGIPITIADVANVALKGAPRRGAASNARLTEQGGEGVPGIVMSIQKSPGTNTLALTVEIDKALDAIEAALPEGVVLNRAAMRQASFIERSIDNVVSKLWQASLFVIIVLILFLVNVRATLITLTAIPLSLAVTFMVMYFTGMSINVMTLGGIAIAIGELVDDAIIDVENVIRRLKQNHGLPEEQRKPFRQVVYDASNEIRGSVVFATVIIVLVMAPLLFLSGLEGRFFQPMGIAYIVAILTSMVVAMSVTPALCRLLFASVYDSNPNGRAGRFLVRFARDELNREQQDSRLVSWLKVHYRRALEVALRQRKKVVSSALAATAATLLLAASYGSSFLPTFNEGTFTVFLMQPLGTSVDASERLGLQIDAQLMEIPGVQSVARRTGRAERDEHAEPPSNSEIEVTMAPGADMYRVRRQIDSILEQIPGITTNIGQPIEHRLSHILSGTPSAIAIDIFGTDLAQMRALVKEVEAALKQVPGARDIAANREVTITTLPIKFKRNELSRWGLTVAEAGAQLSAGFDGAVANRVQDGIRLYEIVVRLREQDRQDIEDLANFRLQNELGQSIYLREVADLGLEQASNLIVRQNGQRKATVSLNVAEGYNLGDLVAEVRKVVDPIVLNKGFYASYGGQFEAQQQASRVIGTLGVVVVILILALLTMALHCFKSALLVMLNLPLALIGGVLAIYFSEGNVLHNLGVLFGGGGEEAHYITPVLSIASLVGFITLFGIAVRSGILLVKQFQVLTEQGVALKEAIIRGSLERLSPILMTALTAMLALIPMAIAAGKPGSELLAPLAIVVLGGLVTATMLNLVVVPAGYYWMFHKRSASQ